MKKLLPFALAALLAPLAPGCTKVSEPTPQVAAQTGAVAGQATPAAGLTAVTATPVGGGTAYTATLNPSGAYAFVTLPVGTYTISYVAAAGYATPASQTVTVTVNNTTTLPAITVLLQQGTLTGNFTPIGGVSSATATAAGGGATYPATINAAAGQYTFANLAVGSYSIAYVVAPGLATPPAQVATVASNTTTTQPVLNLAVTRPFLLTSHSWRLTGFTASSGSQTVDVYANTPACQRDNFTRFNFNRTGVTDEGATKCSTTDPQTTSFPWDFASSETKLVLGAPSTSYDILQLTETTLQLRIVPSPTQTNTLTFTAF